MIRRTWELIMMLVSLVLAILAIIVQWVVSMLEVTFETALDKIEQAMRLQGVGVPLLEFQGGVHPSALIVSGLTGQNLSRVFTCRRHATITDRDITFTDRARTGTGWMSSVRLPRIFPIRRLGARAITT